MDIEQAARAELAILEGPPYTDADHERQERRTDREVWRRLLVFKRSGVRLSSDGNARVDVILSRHPQWKEPVEKGEFPIWMSSGEIGQEFHPAPASRRELEAWLIANPSTKNFDEADDWRDRCRNDFSRCATALLSPAIQNHWPTDRWRQALQAWSEEQLAEISWRHLSRILAEAPADVIDTLQHPIGWWLKACAKQVAGEGSVFFILVKRVLRSASTETVDQQNGTISAAINHPVGYVTEACLTWWYAQGLQDGQGLGGEILEVFSCLMDLAIVPFQHGRLLLCTHIITVFRVDRAWTASNLLPLFDWADEVRARAAWSGFLWSPRLYWPLLASIKRAFLATASHYAALDDLKEQYVGLLTYAALEGNGTISPKKFATTFGLLPSEALGQAVSSVTDAIESAGDKRSEYWENRAKPYFLKIWPKSRELLTPNISGHFARLIVNCGDAFPDALATLEVWLQPTEHADFAIHQLEESRLCTRFPAEALKFLSLVFNSHTMWSARDTRACLAKIIGAQSSLTADLRYINLDTILRGAGQ